MEIIFIKHTYLTIDTWRPPNIEDVNVLNLRPKIKLNTRSTDLFMAFMQKKALNDWMMSV